MSCQKDDGEPPCHLCNNPIINDCSFVHKDLLKDECDKGKNFGNEFFSDFHFDMISDYHEKVNESVIFENGHGDTMILTVTNYYNSKTESILKLDEGNCSWTKMDGEHANIQLSGRLPDSTSIRLGILLATQLFDIDCVYSEFPKQDDIIKASVLNITVTYARRYNYYDAFNLFFDQRKPPLRISASNRAGWEAETNWAFYETIELNNKKFNNIYWNNPPKGVNYEFVPDIYYDLQVGVVAIEDRENLLWTRI